MAGQAKDISSSPNPLEKVLRKGRHWVWGRNRRRSIKDSIYIVMYKNANKHNTEAEVLCYACTFTNKLTQIYLSQYIIFNNKLISIYFTNTWNLA